MEKRNLIIRNSAVLFIGIFVLFQLLDFLSVHVPQIREFNSFVSEKDIDVSALFYTDEEHTFEAIQAAEERTQ